MSLEKVDDKIPRHCTWQGSSEWTCRDESIHSDCWGTSGLQRWRPRNCCT